MNTLSRRSFLKTSALVTASTALSARSWAQVAGANGDIRVAVVGLNGRGKSHLSSLSKVKGVRVVDTAVIEKTKENLAKTGLAVANLKTYVDLRELLASPDIDAVTIATPN